MYEFKIVNEPTRSHVTMGSFDIRAVMEEAEGRYPNRRYATGWMRSPDNHPHILGGHHTAPCCSWMRRKDEKRTVAIDLWIQYEIKDMQLHPTGLIIYRTA